MRPRRVRSVHKKKPLFKLQEQRGEESSKFCPECNQTYDTHRIVNIKDYKPGLEMTVRSLMEFLPKCENIVCSDEVKTFHFIKKLNDTFALGILDHFHSKSGQMGVYEWQFKRYDPVSRWQSFTYLRIYEYYKTRLDLPGCSRRT